MPIFWRPRNCVLWFDFAEPFGDTVYDLSGNGNRGTIYGATRVRGPLMRALSFDGVDDYVEASLSFPDPYSDFTIEVLYYPRDLYFETGIDRGLIRFTAPTTIVLEKANNVPRLYWRSTDGGELTYIKTNFTVVKREWLHIILARKDTLLYGAVNGQITWSETDTRDTRGFEITGVRISKDVFGDPFYGNMAFIRIYSCALSEKEIKAHYNYLFSVGKSRVPSKYVVRGVTV